ncbi:MAG: peptidase [Gammaproteobacteria bacterium]|nr:peptidase [Gammaproteobacteria bacterium]
MYNKISEFPPKNGRPVWTPTFDLLGEIEDEMIDIPLLGYVTAGLPIEVPEAQEMISVPAGMMRKCHYALRVRGNSMIDDNILDGDLILIESRETAENGQSVVAKINGCQVTLKKLYIEKDRIRLQPANDALPPLYFRHDEIEVVGLVKAVVRLP